MGYNNTKFPQRIPTQQYQQNPNWRVPRQDTMRKTQPKHGKNPLDRYGNQTKCAICHSINHWAQRKREYIHSKRGSMVVLHQID